MTEIEQDYLDGMPLKLMRIKYNLSYTMICNKTKHLPRRQPARRNVARPLNATEIEQICEMYNPRTRLYQIADELVLSQKRVRDILSCYGILPIKESILDDPQKAIELYLEEPTSLTVFCAKHNIARTSMTNVLKKHNIPLWKKRNYGSRTCRLKIVEMFNAGIPIKLICSRLKVCKSTVVDASKGIWRRKPLTEKQKRDIIDLTMLGYNYKYICDRVEVSWSSYYRVLKNSKSIITQTLNRKKTNKKDQRLATLLLERLQEGTLFKD